MIALNIGSFTLFAACDAETHLTSRWRRSGHFLFCRLTFSGKTWTSQTTKRPLLSRFGARSPLGVPHFAADRVNVPLHATILLFQFALRVFGKIKMLLDHSGCVPSKLLDVGIAPAVRFCFKLRKILLMIADHHIHISLV